MKSGLTVSPQSTFAMKFEQIASNEIMRVCTARPTGLFSPPPDFSIRIVRFPISRPVSFDSLIRRMVRPSTVRSRPRISATRITGSSTPSSWASGSSPHSPPTIPHKRSRIRSTRQSPGDWPNTHDSNGASLMAQLILPNPLASSPPPFPASRIPPASPSQAWAAGSGRSICSAGFRSRAAGCLPSE